MAKIRFKFDGLSNYCKVNMAISSLATDYGIEFVESEDYDLDSFKTWAIIYELSGKCKLGIKDYSVDIKKKQINVTLKENGGLDSYLTDIKKFNRGIKDSFERALFYIGIWYVDCIKYITAAEMANRCQMRYNLNNVKREYKELYSDYDISSKDIWWTEHVDNDNMDPREIKNPMQSVMINVPAISAMGCFSKEEHTIYMCRENIKNTCKNLSKYEPLFCQENMAEFYKLVLMHEFGHSVFQYLYKEDTPISNERRANYFASLFYNGKRDSQIKCLTCFQPIIYKFPLLSLAYSMYMNKGKKKYELFLEEYDKKVGEIYGL